MLTYQIQDKKKSQVNKIQKHEQEKPLMGNT